jgi:starch synthase (maltosyl-transferring)
MTSSEHHATIQPPSSVIIDNVTPIIDCGRYPVKREVGDLLVVEADIFKEGHDKLAALLLHRPAADQAWRETEMEPLGNDRWTASFPLTENAR